MNGQQSLLMPCNGCVIVRSTCYTCMVVGAIPLTASYNRHSKSVPDSFSPPMDNWSRGYRNRTIGKRNFPSN